MSDMPTDSGASLPDTVVTLIHGTFAKNADWVQPNAPLSLKIQGVLNKKQGDTHIVPFHWSGENSVYARTIAAKDLVSHLDALRKTYPVARQYVVAHSHGGNIALYAASLLRDHKLAGIVCLATPFLQAKARDLSVFTGQALRNAIGVLFAMVAFFITLIFDLSWWWLIGLMLASSIEGAFFASLIRQTVYAFARIADSFAAKIDAKVPKGTDILIVRSVGDEASFVLGAVQLLSWAASKSFSWMLESSNRMLPPFHLTFPKWRMRGVRLPKILWWFWSSIFVFAFLSPACSVIFGRQPNPADLWIDYIALAVVLFATVSLKTNILDGPLLGVAFLVFTICVIINSKWLGTKPSKIDLPDVALRSASGMLLALIVEVNAEPAPPGRWQIEQLDHGSLVRRSVNAFQHSVYEDPRAHEVIADWLQRRNSVSGGRA